MSGNDKDGTGQQRYAQLQARYGHLKAGAFAPTIHDGHGNADWLACHVMEWILDWFRPTRDGRPRLRGGELRFPSDWLAENEFFVTPSKLKYARMTIGRAGLATFHTRRHDCWVEVHWDAVAEALDDRRKLTPNDGLDGASMPCLESRRSVVTPSKSSRQGNNAPSHGLDGALLPHIPPLPSSPPSSSPRAAGAAGLAGTRSEEEDAEIANTPEALMERARSLVAQSSAMGRRCDGEWARRASKAYVGLVAHGYDPDAIDASYMAYLGTVNPPNADDLWHYLTCRDLRGNPRANAPFVEHYRNALERREIEGRRREGILHRLVDRGTTIWQVEDESGIHLLPDTRGVTDEAEARRIYAERRSTAERLDDR